MRPLWSGMICFGLVNIPVRLYTAVKSREFELNFLHKNDLSPIQYKKICRLTGKEVPMKEIVKGYQYQKGDYVILEEKDFEKAGVERSYSIDIQVFVNEKEVDVMYYDKPYFLEPEKKSFKTYALFRDAMAKAGKVGIGKFVLKTKEHLVMLKPDKEMILLEALRFQSMLQDPEELAIPSKEKTPSSQMELALELIGKMEGHFKPESFKDTYTEKLEKIVEAKKKGKPIHVKIPKIEETEVQDLMQRLKESLSAA